MSTLDCLVSEARAAFAAADALDLVRREKSLTKLFTALQGAVATVADTHLPELGAVLARLSEIISALPHNSAAEAKRRAELKDVYECGQRTLPVGVVLIIADDSYPIASWALPLGHCLRDGNEAVLVTSTRTLLVSVLEKTRVFECDGPLQALPTVEGVVGPRHLLPSPVQLASGAGLSVLALETGPVPVLIDSSVLKAPREEMHKASAKIPHEIERIAAQVKYLHERAYVLISSELSDLFAGELGARPHEYLSAPPESVGVYTFSSLEQAAEIAAQIPAHATVIYAERAIAAKAAAKMRRTVHVNGYPASLVLGPYTGDLGVVKHVEVTLNQMPRHWCRALIKRMAPRSAGYAECAMRESPGIEDEKDPRYWDYDADGAGSWGMGWAFAV